MAWALVAIVLLHLKNKDTSMLFHPGINFCINCEKQQKLAEPDVVHPYSELKSPLGDSRLLESAAG